MPYKIAMFKAPKFYILETVKLPRKGSTRVSDKDDKEVPTAMHHKGSNITLVGFYFNWHCLSTPRRMQF